jgi:hypothetical protein
MDSRPEDLAFIAASREWIPKLLDEVERLGAALRALKGHAANDFVETWESFSVDDFSVDQPENVCAPDDDVADMLEELDDRP